MRLSRRFDSPIIVVPRPRLARGSVSPKSSPLFLEQQIRSVSLRHQILYVRLCIPMCVKPKCCGTAGCQVPVALIDSRDVSSSSREVEVRMATAGHPTACETACVRSAWTRSNCSAGSAARRRQEQSFAFSGLIKSAPIAGSSAQSARAAPTILSLGQNAHRLFAVQPASEKRSLLNSPLSNSTWVRDKLSIELKEPFDLLIETSRPPNASKRPRVR